MPPLLPHSHVLEGLNRRAAAALSSLSTRATTTLLSTPIINEAATQVLPKRQSTATNLVSISSTYGSINSGPDPGTVVGIVLGSVCGFLLLLYLFNTCMNFSGQGISGESDVASTVMVRERRRSRASKSQASRRSRRKSETVEIRRGSSPRAPPRAPPPPPERIIVEEEVRTTRPVSRPPSRMRVVEDEDDEVVVIEEHSPPRKSKSRRDREREREMRDSGYRPVDPGAYAGGNSPLRDMGRRSSRGSRH